jgi:hypothetical protein
MSALSPHRGLQRRPQGVRSPLVVSLVSRLAAGYAIGMKTLSFCQGIGRSTFSSLKVPFFLCVFFLTDFAFCIALVQNLFCRFGASHPTCVRRHTRKRSACHEARSAPHHEKTQGKHDDDGDGNYPPPPKPTTEGVVSPHLNHVLSGRLVRYFWARISEHFSRRLQTYIFVRGVP